MKRKLLCIAVAVIMILPLAFAAIPMASAAVADGWEFTSTGGASAANFKVNADGSLSMGWGNPGVYWANLGACYDASAYNNNYTVTVEAYVPQTQNACPTNGVPVVGVMANFAGVDMNWIPSMAVKLSNYEGMAAGTPENYAAWGNTYNVVELFDNGTALACAAAPYSIIGIESGAWNTVKIVNNNGVVSMWVNDVCICVDYTVANANGNYVVLGSNGDCGDWNNMPSFRNFVITSNDDSVETYKAYTYEKPFDPAQSNWTILAPIPVAPGAANGTVSYASNGVINLNSNTGWWGQAGVVYNDKINANDLTVTLNKTANTDPSPNGHTDFILSATKPTTYSLQMSGNTYFPDCNPATTLAIHVGGDGLLYGSGTVGAISFINTFANNVDNTFSVGAVYEVEGKKYVKIYLNGEVLQVMGEDENENPTPYEYEFDVTSILDDNNAAYVVVGATGYGGSGCTAEIKTINGVVAGKYKGAANNATIAGAQYRTEGEAGLRFLTNVALNNVNNNDSIKRMGTLIIPADKLGDAALVLSEDGKANGVSYLDIVAKNYYEKTDDMISFTAVLIGIPEDKIDRDFVAVSYIVYEDGTVTYSDACVRAVIDFLA